MLLQGLLQKLKPYTFSPEPELKHLSKGDGGTNLETFRCNFGSEYGTQCRDSFSDNPTVVGLLDVTIFSGRNFSLFILGIHCLKSLNILSLFLRKITLC